jgi:hypothetical protein
MIFHAAYDDGFEALIAGDSSHVSPQFGLKFVGNAFVSFLGAEDYVDSVA